MAFNGSGVFSRLYNWQTDKLNNIKILASRMDSEMDGMAAGLSNCMTKDGQQTVTADIPMSGFHFTGLGAGASSGDSVEYDQMNAAIAALSTVYQPLDAELTALAGLTSAADKLPYFTGSGTAGVADFSSFARTLLDDADAATARATLGAAASASPTFTGVVSFPDGSAAAPSIANTGDLDTGIYFPSNNAIGFATAGLQRITISSAGQLIFGAASGNGQVHMYGASAAVLSTVAASTNNLAGNGGTMMSIENDGDVDGGYAGIQFTTTNAGGANLQIAHIVAEAQSAGNAPAMVFMRRSGTTAIESARFNPAGDFLLSLNSSPPTLSTNGRLAINATSNTNLRFSYRGSDGTTRTADLTLA